MADAATECFLSDVSLLELAVKVSVRKLRLELPLEEWVARAEGDLALRRLRLERSHLFRLSSLPVHHRDPFDRLLVAQAREEGLSLVTSDPAVRRYGVPIEW
jgi:PIN domain nuclease of toxin-antitoxin system